MSFKLCKLIQLEEAQHMFTSVKCFMFSSFFVSFSEFIFHLLSGSCIICFDILVCDLVFNVKVKLLWCQKTAENCVT